VTERHRPTSREREREKVREKARERKRAGEIENITRPTVT